MNRAKEYFAGKRTVARWWTDDILDSYFYKEQVGWVEKIASSRGKELCLDIGAGTGRFIGALSRLAKDVVAIDISREMLEKVRKKFPKACIVLADAENLPFRKSTFDLCICIEVMMHLPNPKRSVCQVNYVTKRKGKILLNFINSWALSSIWIRVTQRLGSLIMKVFHHDVERVPVKLYTPPQILHQICSLINLVDVFAMGIFFVLPIPLTNYSMFPKHLATFLEQSIGVKLRRKSLRFLGRKLMIEAEATSST